MRNILIRKDHHFRSNHLLTKFKIGWSWQQRYFVKFDETAQYHLVANRTQVNKLVGVGQVHHHLNSIRIGWRWDENRSKVELVAYRYRSGKMDYAHLCFVDINKEFEVIVRYEYKDGEITSIVWCGNNRVCYLWKVNKWYEKLPLLYECYPYFGGYMPAPYDIRIFIENSRSIFRSVLYER